MAQIVLRQFGPRAGDRGTIKSIEIQRPSHNSVKLLDESGNVVWEAEVNPTTGDFVLPQGTVGSAGPKKKVTKFTGKRNWRVENGVFYIKPDDGAPAETELQFTIHEGSEHTPSGVPEVLGQNALLYSICLGLHLSKHSMAIGPTGTAKTTAYRWIAQTLGYNLVFQPCARGTESAHMVGEFLPNEEGHFNWVDGPVTQAVRLSQETPTILVFDEVNRIGNIAEFARFYSLLDDSRYLEIKELNQKEEPGMLYIGATMNPSDDENHADYIGAQELDPAFNSRFALQAKVSYPPLEVEAATLAIRTGCDADLAIKMVEAAKRIRESENVTYDISFRELESWARCEPYLGYVGAAELAVISKAQATFRKDIRNLLQLTEGK